MNFNSLHFLIFFPVVLIVFRLLPKKVKWIWLLGASWYFYMSWDPWLIFLILGTTVTAYIAGMLLEKTEKTAVRRLLLIVTLVVCLGILVFFKYFDFLLESVYAIINLFTPLSTCPSLDLILPVGISFYTFQTLSYVIDVYRGKFGAEKHFGYFALFVSFFPQLVAGPIERPGDLIPQLRAPRKMNADDMEAGLRIMLSGFFRKCVIADSLAVFVDSVFADVSAANSLAIAVAGFLFLIQIYCDFAGYSEIAMGAARMMGIDLTVNFAQPLLAVGFRDFFRRWHITLTRWFMDYLYIPLGGNRKGKVRRIINTFIVFAVCGLWHGANWTYVMWGLYAALFITLELVLEKPLCRLAERMHIDAKSVPVVFLRRFVFLLLSIPNALIFRSVSPAEAFECLAGLFGNIGFGTAYLSQAMATLSMTMSDLLQVVLSIICLYFLGKFAFSRVNGKPGLHSALIENCGTDKTNIYARISSYWFGTVAVALGWLVLIASSDSSAFAYFQF